MASDRRNASSQEHMKKKAREEEEDEIEMNDDDDDDAGGAVVDTSRSRDGLLCTLLRLKLFVLCKKLVRSYLSRNQNYLGITQTEYDAGFRRRQGQRVLTDEEHRRVHAAGGLPLRALDRRGVTYPMVLVHHAKTCRLRTGWGDFLRSFGVRQDDDTHVGDVVEIWAFRSPAWPTGLGLVLLHYTKKEDAIITASLLEQEEEQEGGGGGDGITTSSDSSSDSDQEAQRVKDQQDDVDEKNCSPLGHGQDGNYIARRWTKK